MVNGSGNDVGGGGLSVADCTKAGFRPGMWLKAGFPVNALDLEIASAW